MKKIGAVLLILLSYYPPIFLLPTSVYAAFNTSIGTGCEIKNGDVPSLGCLADVIVNIINFALSLVAALTLIFLLLGTFRLVISRGDPKALDSAKKTITYAFLGFFLVFFSALIINFVTGRLGLGNILTNFTLYQK